MIFSAVVTLAFIALRNSIPPKFYYENIALLIIFFFVVTVGFHFALLYGAEKSDRNVVSYYMIATALKFLLFAAIMIVYALINRGKSLPFISNFFIIYVLFTVFEVSVNYRFFKQKFKPQNNV